MNIIQYISSGILEAYVLGSTTPQEKQEVECMSKIYPEIKTELDALQGALNQYASSFEKSPPAHLKAKIFAQMQFDEVVSKADSNMEGGKTKELSLWPRISVAAALIFGALTIWSYFENNKLKTFVSNYKQKNQVLSVEKSFKESLLSLYKNPEILKLKLKGTAKSPESEVVLFWNKNRKELKLIVENLPKVPEGKQYQLWSIIDGKPVDMGVLDNEFTNRVYAIQPPNGTVAAFAITLEKQGGSPTPTLEEMYVIGNV